MVPLCNWCESGSTFLKFSYVIYGSTYSKSYFENGTSNYKTKHRDELYSTVTMQLELTRQSFYYVFNLMIPTTLVSLVAIIGFHAPSRSTGGRDSKFRLGITTLLSMGVMLLMVVNEMPKFSLASQPGQRGSFSDVPLLGLFYLSLILTISLGTCTSSIFVILEKYGAKRPQRNQIPAIIRWLDFDCSRPRLWTNFMRNSTGSPALQSAEEQNALIHEKNCTFHHKENDKRIAEIIRAAQSTITDTESNREPPERNQNIQETILHTELVLLEKLCQLVSEHLAALNNDKQSTVSDSNGQNEKSRKRMVSPSNHYLSKSWRRVISRLELFSLFCYLGLICMFVLSFFYPESWY